MIALSAGNPRSLRNKILVKFVEPTDDVNKKLLSLSASEKAIEEVLEEVRNVYRKKKITLNEYLDKVRTLSEKQFISIATQRKIRANME